MPTFSMPVTCRKSDTVYSPTFIRTCDNRAIANNQLVARGGLREQLEGPIVPKNWQAWVGTFAKIGEGRLPHIHDF